MTEHRLSNMRRRKPSAERREKMIGVKVTDAEYETLRAMAFEAHLSLGALLRECALAPRGKRPRAKTPE